MEIPRYVIKSALPSSAPLPRTLGSPNLARFFHSTTSQCKPPATPLSESETSSSRSSGALYMKDNKTARRALSSLNNVSEHILGGQVDRKETSCPAEDVVWSIVDQEIFEWQYSCHTGRPYWWASESKYTRPKNMPSQMFTEQGPRVWQGDTNDQCWRPSYNQQRRAVSEGFAQDPDAPEDLAHLVAIQLLGSCFTLAPDHIAGASSPNYSKCDEKGFALPDPRMISSLRIHSHFRYSPSFGHQARNGSPASMWMAFDGPCPPRLDLQRRNNCKLEGRQPSMQRGGRGRESSDGGSFDGTIEKEFGADMESNAEEEDKDISQTSQLSPDTIGRSHPTFNFIRHESLQAEVGSSDGEDAVLDSDEVTPSFRSPKSERGLHSVLRSEPRHVFVRPVRELVVRRWKTFTTRISTGIHGHLRSEDESESGQSTCSSAGTNNDGKSRRRRAQEDSEIDGSMDSVAHLNTPITGQATPQVSSTDSSHLAVSRNPTFQFQLADPLVAAAELVAALSTARFQKLQRSSVEGQGDHPAHESTLQSGPRINNNGITTPEHGPEKDQTTTSPKLPAVPRSYSTRRNQGRKRRKSMLSEVYTVDEYDQEVQEKGEVRNPHIAALSMLSSPPEEVEPLSPIRQQHSWLHTSTSSDSVSGESLDRPSFCRLSTSGTQVFTPSRDGIEVDGLPVGPTKNVWDEEK